MNTYKPEGMLIKTAKNHEYISTVEGLERALEHQVILEAPAILCDHNFNLHVSLGAHIRGIIPREEAMSLPDGAEIKDIAILTRVGKPVAFKVTGISRDERGDAVAYLSRRAAQRECIFNYIDTLLPGDIIETKVTHLENFGAFVDIGCGIVSLLSIDSISVSRISHPKERLAVGDAIKAVVKAIDDRGRIYVSTRELLGTWEENAALFEEGQTVRGIIRSIEPYGIFVELTPNLAGLAEYRAGTKENQIAAVYIKSIIPDKMKIKLIIIDAQECEDCKTIQKTFIDTGRVSHMDRWLYSPIGARRTIETIFT